MALMMWWAISGVLSFGAVPLLLPVFEGQLRQNYLGKAVPTGLGVAFVIPSALIISRNELKKLGPDVEQILIH